MSEPTMPIYLDYNATTPLLPEVVDAMLPFLRTHFGNPSSGHAYGAEPRRAVAQAREGVAALLGAHPEEIVFTSGGIEANNLAIRGVAALTDRRHMVTSSIEHPATEGPCTYLESHGWAVTRLGVDAQGRVEMREAERSMGPQTALVTVMHANNETGTIQPIRELADLAKTHGALVHTDAAQSLGKVPVNVDDLGVDLLSVVGHKVYGPKGVGALYVRRGTPIHPVLLGSPGDLRPGTLNVPAIVGLGMACGLAQRDLETEGPRLRAIRDELWARLRDAVPGLVLHGQPTGGLPNTLNLRFPGVRGSALLAAAPGLTASTGAACHSGDEHPSRVLLAMGVSPSDALGAIRISLGRGVESNQVPGIAQILVQAWRDGATPRIPGSPSGPPLPPIWGRRSW